MAKVIAVVNQKGGVGKTMTAMSLGIGLTKEGKRVLLIDADPQGSLTICMGYKNPDKLRVTLKNIMEALANEDVFEPRYGILHYSENVDLLPSNIELAGVEISLVSVFCREMLLKNYVDLIRDEYDYIIIDCMPSLGIITVNALVSANSVIIPVQAAYLPVKGLQQLIRTISMVRRQLNKSLCIEGILFTMVDRRTLYAREIVQEVRNTYENVLPIFSIEIPFSVRMAETSAIAISIFDYDSKGKVADAYKKLTKEVMQVGC